MAKILIVEDNQGTNKAICEYMKEAGHTLFSAFTGSEALKIFRGEELDIIVLDIMLPEMSGIVVLHEIRKVSNIPVIMLTALDDEYTQSNSFDEMADFPIGNIDNKYIARVAPGKHSLVIPLGSKATLTIDDTAIGSLPKGKYELVLTDISGITWKKEIIH